MKKYFICVAIFCFGLFTGMIIQYRLDAKEYNSQGYTASEMTDINSDLVKYQPEFPELNRP